MVDRVERGVDGMVVEVRAAAESVACPGCGTVSERVHGRYRRSLADTPLGGAPVVIRLLVRRFACREAGCGRRTFAEQIPGLTVPHARHSPPLRHALTAVALALGGRAGARLARALGMPTAHKIVARPNYASVDTM